MDKRSQVIFRSKKNIYEEFTNFNRLFNGCEKLENVDISKWGDLINDKVHAQRCRKMFMNSNVTKPVWVEIYINEKD